MPDPDEMKDKGGQAVQDMKDKAGDAGQQAKKKMDRNNDGKVDKDDAKRMGEDAVNKVKGLFKKE